MSDMLERAARGACNAMHGGEAICLSEAERATRTPCRPDNCATVAAVRAALLAALDPTDQGLVQCIARALYASKPPLEADDFEFDAHSVIIALKASIAQGEPLP